MTKKSTIWLCKHCKTLESIPDNEFGIRTEEITVVYCPSCLAKGKQRKMVKQE